VKNVLITGITGFAGAHLANYLAEHDPEHQFRIWGLVRASNGRENDIRDVVTDKVYGRLNFVYGNLDDRESLVRVFRTREFHQVYHLAAQSHPPTSFEDPQGTFVTNAVGTVGLVELLMKYSPKCRMMNCSTSEVYGAVAEDEQPITEECPIAPVNPYGVSKAAADLYVGERARSKGLRAFNTRAFSHTGTRRGFTFSISGDAYQLMRIKKGLQEPVVKVGTLSSRRVVMDVRDCVRGYAMLMDKFTPGEAYNVGGDELYSMGELLDMMIEMTGLDVEKVVNPAFVRPIDIPLQIPDSTKCRTLTGWQPRIPIRQTLAGLLDYWDEKIKE
jgi:GDP-mannose 4,6-dehydratase